jgi:hypothetical protein
MAHVGAVAPRQLKMGRDAGLLLENAGVRFTDRDEVIGEAEAGEADGHLGGGEIVMSQAMRAGGGEDAPDQRAVRRADGQPAGDSQEPPAAGRLEIAPEDVGALDQGHVLGRFEVGLTDGSRSAVGGTPGVARLVRIQPEHPSPALGDMKGRGAAHRAEAEDDDVIRRHGDGPSADRPAASSSSRRPPLSA